MPLGIDLGSVRLIGLGTEFCSEKILQNRLGTVSVIPRKKTLIPRHSEFPVRTNSKARNGTERHGIPQTKLVLPNSSKLTLQNDLSVHQKSSFLTLLLKYSTAAFCSKLVSLPRNGSERHSESIFQFFCCTEKNSDLCSLPRNGLERNSEILHLFGFHGTEFRFVFSSAEGFGPELWEFASIFVSRNGTPSCFLFRGRVRNGIPRFSVPRNNQNSIGNNHLFCLFRLPRNYIFVGNSKP